jgi:hypothetical protein
MFERAETLMKQLMMKIEPEFANGRKDQRRYSQDIRGLRGLDGSILWRGFGQP